MGFVSLPIEGDPTARLSEVLDQIQAALAEDRYRKVRRVGNRIEFSTDSFLRRWFFPGRSISGEIEAEASNDCLMIDYRLSFFEPFVVAFGSVAVCSVVLALQHGIALVRSIVPLLLIVLVFSLGVRILRTVFEFSRFLRQFPREVEYS